MIQSKLYRNIKIICGNDILVNNNVMYLVWMYIMRWMNNGYGDQGGEAVTSATLNKAGIYLAYYENNTLQLLY